MASLRVCSSYVLDTWAMRGVANQTCQLNIPCAVSQSPKHLARPKNAPTTSKRLHAFVVGHRWDSNPRSFVVVLKVQDKRTNHSATVAYQTQGCSLRVPAAPPPFRPRTFFRAPCMHQASLSCIVACTMYKVMHSRILSHALVGGRRATR